MDILFKLTDKDIGEKENELKSNHRLRIASRGIVLRDDGKIAVFNKTNKNEYKLPGGGLEGNELPESAFKREVLEETGCEVEIINKLGVVEEENSLDNYKQISHIFVGKVLKDYKKLNLTKKEKDEGARLLWVLPEEALKLIKDCKNKIISSNYYTLNHTKFVVLRDSKILEYYLDNM